MVKYKYVLRASQKQWRDPTKDELYIIQKIIRAGARAHENDFCFSTAHNTLMTLKVDAAQMVVVGTNAEQVLYIEVQWIRRNEPRINNYRPAGYYKPRGTVYEPIDDLFSFIPNVE